MSNKYYSLIASLPHLPRRLEGVERLPINRLRLEERLKLLKPEDAQVVDQMLGFLQWDRQRRERTDDDVIRRYHSLMKTLSNPLAKHIIALRMDVRTITSALRRRRRGLPPPQGVGQWVRHIQRNWEHPEFNLGHRYPWIVQVEESLDKGDFLQTERLLLEATWNEWNRLAEKYHFSFEAVLLYLVRWEFLHRWSRRDRGLGQLRFGDLVDEMLAGVEINIPEQHVAENP